MDTPLPEERVRPTHDERVAGHRTETGRSLVGMTSHIRLAGAAALALLIIQSASALAGQAAAQHGRLVVYGDTTYFFGLGIPRSCALSSQFKRGEPIGFRMTAIDPMTGARDRATSLVVHLTYAGRTIDIPMRDRETTQQPERTFWVAKWVVPEDAQTGVLRYTVTARDSQGRTGEFKPFDVATSQITIVE